VVTNADDGHLRHLIGLLNEDNCRLAGWQH
jgi:hypothetical protein